jgi:hypothetical protein
MNFLYHISGCCSSMLCTKAEEMESDELQIHDDISPVNSG